LSAAGSNHDPAQADPNTDPRWREFRQATTTIIQAILEAPEPEQAAGWIAEWIERNFPDADYETLRARAKRGTPEWPQS